MNFYDEHHAKLQEQFESRDLAQAMEFAAQPRLCDRRLRSLLGRS